MPIRKVTGNFLEEAQEAQEALESEWDLIASKQKKPILFLIPKNIKNNSELKIKYCNYMNSKYSTVKKINRNNIFD